MPTDSLKSSSNSIPVTRQYLNSDDYQRRYPLLSLITYHPPINNRQTRHKKSLSVIGLDSEADRDGKTFLWCSSLGDSWTDEEIPRAWFSRRYLGCNFVVYNLKYETGAIIKRLPKSSIDELRTEGTTEHDGYKYTVIGDKSLTIRRGKNSIHFYDIHPFYLSSLDSAASTYLNESKDETDPELFFPWFIRKYLSHIKKYCVQDAVLTQRLAELIIDNFESFGVRPQKLYSTAYVSWQYFRTHCKYIHVKRFWDFRPEVLEYALRAYNGGKFEVTRKGSGYYYEYDIVSAYPSEIANLVDISKARVQRSPGYEPEAQYSLLYVNMFIPPGLPNPTPIQVKGLNVYPAGRVSRWIHKCEYDYFVESGIDIQIIDAVHLFVGRKFYPYKKEIEKLMVHKDRYKADGDAVRYKLVKILLNSLYGKFVQLTDTPRGLRAGAAWNPVYGGHITAAVRVRMARLQREYQTVVAVHTDSVISTSPLDTVLSSSLGGLAFETEGNGLILGSGIYQIGDKSRFRGFPTKRNLLDMIPDSGKIIPYTRTRPFGWREISYRKLARQKINYFAVMEKAHHLNCDKKRIWVEDWEDFSEVMNRNVESLPHILAL